MLSPGYHASIHLDICQIYPTPAIARRGLNGMPRFTRVELPDSDLEVIAAYLTRSGPRP